MPTLTTDDDVELHYEDQGTGKPVLLIHGWPLSRRSWEPQVLPLVEAGHRVVTYLDDDALAEFEGGVRGDRLDVPTLIIHGDSDATVPFEVSGKRSHEAIDGAELALIEGAPHGLNVTHADEFNAALLDFLSR